MLARFKKQNPTLENSLSPSMLLPYQRRWVEDGARFKIGLWARQTGKDFSSAYEAVMDSIRNPKTMWVILASGERQALESMAKAKEWAESLAFTAECISEKRAGPEALIRSAEILWENGSRLIALPAKPATARGYSANLILTEFAFHEKPEEIWRAIYPSISNPLRGGAKKLRVISTPNGKGNKFFDLWHRHNDYSKHKVDIHDAVRQGLPVDIDALRAGLDDPEGWVQEYECEFIDTAAVLLPYELIAACESPEADETMSVEQWPSDRNRLFLGIDFGRKKDLTVCWTLEWVGDVLWTREVLTLAQMPTPLQIERLRPRVGLARKVCVDYTGPGIGLGDYLAREHGEWSPERHRYGKIELCHFTAGLKLELYPRLRMKFEERALRIPVSRAIREDLHAMQRITTLQGNITYRAPHTEDGHSDRCAALALAVRSAGEPGESSSAAVLPNARRGRAVASRRERTVIG
jgi:phage FluMu gp28-like protein